MNILVMGGGAQGRVIAADLARWLPRARVDVADIRDPKLNGAGNLRWIEADCSDPATLVRLMREHDLAVGALPARFGFRAMKAAIEAKRNLVDVSFCAENVLPLDAEARAAGVALVPDCGLAPGISHLMVGRAAAERGTPDEVMIMVGGVAEERSRPYGYVVTWSLDDLLEEYQRPARIVAGGRPTTVPVFSGLERVPVDGVGELEAFYSDGLRTLLDTLPGVKEMGEKTLRWPGHAQAVEPLVRAGRFVEEFRARCLVGEPRDVVVLIVRLRWGNRTAQALLVDRFNAATGMTAMARTTALTTATVAQLAAEGGIRRAGVLPLERVAEDADAHRYVVDGLARRGVRVHPLAD
jgi:saccharopine dehydrogenase-like NADP-dependent oxidoreductase